MEDLTLDTALERADADAARVNKGLAFDQIVFDDTDAGDDSEDD